MVDCGSDLHVNEIGGALRTISLARRGSGRYRSALRAESGGDPGTQSILPAMEVIAVHCVAFLARCLPTGRIHHSRTSWENRTFVVIPLRARLEAFGNAVASQPIT